MRSIQYLYIIIALLVYPGISGFGAPFRMADTSFTLSPDTLDNQILYNGRLWRNLYSRVKGTPFLFTEDFVNGTVTMGETEFKNVSLKYDIYNDEIIAISDKGFIVQLNKEMVNAFSLNYHDRVFSFLKVNADTTKNPEGFVNVLVDGKVSLYVKYKKNILFLAVDNKYDLFNQVQKIYIMKDGEVYPVNSRGDLFGLLSSHKQELKSFIKSRSSRISKSVPDSFVPVIEYYNTLESK
jgi:hypothetical protein